MNIQLFLLIIVVVTALAFDFTTGFHDTGNAMATSIASGALSPKVAVALSAVLNLFGAFMSTTVAATIAKGLIDAHVVTLVYRGKAIDLSPYTRQNVARLTLQ